MAPGHEPNGQAAEWPELALDASPLRTLAALAGFAALAAVTATMAFDLLGRNAPWSIRLVAWAGLIFFGGCLLLGLRLAMMRGPIVTVGPRGVRDVRISPDWIPWTAIIEVAELSPDFLLLRIDPAFEATMS